MTDNVTVTDVEILNPGTYLDANNNQVVITAADIAELAAVYDPDFCDAPAVVGHPKMDDPAYGWMRNLRVEGEILLCDLVDVDPEFAATLKAKRYKNKSLAYWRPTTRGNPKPGKNYPKHLGLLGAKAPAVRGLKPITLADGDEATIIELASPDGWRVSWAFRSIAGALSRFRDYLVQEKGVEEADKILPSYLADDVRNAAAEIDAAERQEAPVATFSSPETPEETSMTEQELQARAAELGRREADLTRRQAAIGEKEVALAAAEAEARTKDDVAFVDGLIAEGRLAIGEKDQVLAELAAMDDGVVIQLAGGDGGTVSQRQAYMNRLKRSPKLVEFGEFDDSDSVVALSSGEDIAAAATDYIADQAKAGRSVTAAQAVSHVMSKRS